MCGVIGLVHERPREDLGVIAGQLLETLQYRGYDSTGAVIQGDEVVLKKGVGAPSVLVHSLGIVEMGGDVFCGQVRWATFGAVDEANAQPHVVRCHTFLYGAHNGNVTNCDELKVWLTERGHDVQSDNDGEMVVHLVEHHFAAALTETDDRAAAMRRAVVKASHQLEGSFAAVIVDPEERTLCAIKRGSSLYFGVGTDERGDAFAIASSDLSSVLERTHVLVALSEGEYVQFDAVRRDVRAIDGTPEGTPLERAPLRSRLRVEDTALKPEYETYMAQEIDGQPETAAEALRMFDGGTRGARNAREVASGWSDAQRAELQDALTALRAQYDDAQLTSHLEAVAALGVGDALANVGADPRELVSAERAFFGDLAELCPERAALVRGLDAYVESIEAEELSRGVEASVRTMSDALDAGRRIYCVCCGTSYHAAKAASLFFAELARAEVIPLLPGEFRGQYAKTIADGDVIVAVSQSGETKDLIDVINGVRADGKRVPLIGVVNNLNSTLAHEKSDVVVPLRCGAEIAVPATKSFINQLCVFYGLARALGIARGRELGERPDIPGLIRETLELSRDAVEEAAGLLHLAPSIHLLATRLLAVAKEGALKVREVVLNHTEGFEGSEFKHGPNTILGFNTLFGPEEVEALLARLARGLGDAEDPAAYVRDGLTHSLDALYRDYPLVFITGPERRDVDLTISQINTHKIRGASTVVIAEEDERLRAAATKPPANNDAYRAVYVPLPSTGDTLMTTFTASVALQRLALRMSERKMSYLESLGFRDHGVHPDVPKNVSKSITVD